ncbi:MAG: hypothetical protein ABR991_11210, partial [Terracidiphilus sp.]
RENFSKLGWQANVIWRIAISTYMQFDASTVQVDDLIRGSLDVLSTPGAPVLGFETWERDVYRTAFHFSPD